MTEQNLEASKDSCWVRYLEESKACCSALTLAKSWVHKKAHYLEEMRAKRKGSLSEKNWGKKKARCSALTLAK